MSVPVQKKINPDPRVFTFDEAKLKRNDKTYQITDLNIQNTKGRIVFTVSVTVLHPAMQTSGHMHGNETEVYEFVEGQGIMIVRKLSLFVKAGDFVFVDKGDFHKVINISKSSDLIFRCYMNGEIERPHLL